MKTVYRNGLGCATAGDAAISGVHYNYSFPRISGPILQDLTHRGGAGRLSFRPLLLAPQELTAGTAGSVLYLFGVSPAVCRPSSRARHDLKKS